MRVTVLSCILEIRYTNILRVCTVGFMRPKIRWYLIQQCRVEYILNKTCLWTHSSIVYTNNNPVKQWKLNTKKYKINCTRDEKIAQL